MKLLQAVLLGIVIGILIAPDKGSETRRKLAGKLSDFGEDAEDYLADAADNIENKAEDIAGTVKSRVTKVVQRAESKAEDLKGNADNI